MVGTVCPNVQLQKGFFQYATNNNSSTNNNNRGTECFMNFADPHVFGYYGGGLLAQDKLQVVEHPVLASVMEALNQPQQKKQKQQQDDSENTTTVAPLTVDSSSQEATPILVQGAPRRLLYFLWIFIFLKKRKELDYKRFSQMRKGRLNAQVEIPEDHFR